jgi:hydroxyacid-oxoacid transhydrogenase
MTLRTAAGNRIFMNCCQHEHYAGSADGDYGFEVDGARITYGRGVLAELGEAAKALHMKRVAVFVDPTLRERDFVKTALDSLRDAKMDAIVYTDIAVEPTDASFKQAAAFATDGKFDGYVSIGGGSTMDTCKAADLYATYPADFMDYVNAPIGAGRPIPGPLTPHIASPTTCGTGSECTGIAIFDYLAMRAKTGIASPALRPTEALVDPDCADSLPREVVASSGFDVLCHALESFTARPFTTRAAPPRPSARPASQGRNPWSDLGCIEALRILGESLVRAANDAADREAREQTMWAATLAGIAFGNAGVHVPHAMSYSVAGLVRDFRPSGYPDDEPMVPHGMSVIVNAPSVFRYTAPTSPERHLRAATLLRAEANGAGLDDAGEVLATRLIALMRALDMPVGLEAIGYGEGDLDALVAGAVPQQRLLKNAPCVIEQDTLRELFRTAMRYA